MIVRHTDSNWNTSAKDGRIGRYIELERWRIGKFVWQACKESDNERVTEREREREREGGRGGGRERHRERETDLLIDGLTVKQTFGRSHEENRSLSVLALHTFIIYDAKNLLTNFVEVICLLRGQQCRSYKTWRNGFSALRIPFLPLPIH